MRDVTVALAAGTKVGTGLFVAPGLVLTCAHVVNEAAEATSPHTSSSTPRLVHGEWREQPITLKVVPEWYHPYEPETGGPDLALLQVEGELVTRSHVSQRPPRPMMSCGHTATQKVHTVRAIR